MKIIDTKYKVGDTVYVWSLSANKVNVKQFIISSIKIDINKKQETTISYMFKGAGRKKHDEASISSSLKDVRLDIIEAIDTQLEKLKLEKPKGIK
jgi:hypothetical protein